MKKKKNEIFLSIISIGTVIMTAIGVTFAYFTTNMSGKAGNILSSVAKVGTITFQDGTTFTTSQDIAPDWQESKTFTITAAPSSISQTVNVKMRYTNNMPDLKCMVTLANNGGLKEGAVGEVILNTTGVETIATLVTKTFEPSSTTQTVTYELTMSLPETGQNQNSSQGKIFEGTMFADLGQEDTLYYNQDNPNGTTIKPTV